MQHRLSLNPDYVFEQLQQMLHRQVASLRNALRSLDDGSYIERGQEPTSTSIIGFQLPTLDEPSKIAQDEIDKTCLSIIRAFTDFIDTLLGIRKLISMPHVVSRSLTTPEELENYVREELAKKAQKVGRDGHLSSHEKTKMLASLPQFLLDAVDGYFDIRTTLEHHKGVAQRRMYLHTYRVEVLADDNPINDLPFHVDKGQTLSVRVNGRTRTFQKGERLDLSESDLEDMVRTILLSIAPQIISNFSNKNS